MKRIISILVAMSMFTMTSYAGQWQHDEIGWRYQNDDGTYKTGWHQDVDGKWYYLDNQTTYMLVNTVTPDGYSVSADGVWENEGTETVDETENYDNKIEFDLTTYSNPGGLHEFGYSIPVKAYYNNEYDNVYTGKIKVKKIELSKDGIPFIAFSGDEKDVYVLNAKCRYVFEDGTYIDKDREICTFSEKRNDEFSVTLFYVPAAAMNKGKIKSINVYVKEGTIFK